jgi:hypothetical protein
MMAPRRARLQARTPASNRGLATALHASPCGLLLVVAAVPQTSIVTDSAEF